MPPILYTERSCFLKILALHTDCRSYFDHRSKEKKRKKKGGVGDRILPKFEFFSTQKLCLEAYHKVVNQIGYALYLWIDLGKIIFWSGI